MSYILPWTYITCIIILITIVVISISDQLSNSPCFQAHPSIFKNLSMLIQKNYKKQWLLRLFLKLTVQNLTHTTTTAIYWGPGKYDETFRQHDTVKGKNQTSILVSTSQQDLSRPQWSYLKIGDYHACISELLWSVLKTASLVSGTRRCSVK